MDLCGPMRVASVNGKKYILVIVDDYSRFTWVKFLRSKDEAPDFIIKFLKMIQVRLKVLVRRIRTDNGTEFVNKTLREYYEKVVISHETSVARFPQQNGVVERRNRTLIEVTRTMLIYAKDSLFLWAEAVATASRNHPLPPFIITMALLAPFTTAEKQSHNSPQNRLHTLHNPLTPLENNDPVGDTSRELWIALERAFAPHTISREYTLKSQLLRLKMEPDETSSAYLLRARQYADALANIGEPFKEKDLVMLVVTWYFRNDEYDGFKSPDFWKPPSAFVQAFAAAAPSAPTASAAISLFLAPDTLMLFSEFCPQLGLHVQDRNPIFTALLLRRTSGPLRPLGGRGRGSHNRVVVLRSNT
ncbi:retrovirus-related pol polyprotein from transposon TNT 1-94 [Tanacetum coccineum]